jgi:hypothetical protein
LQHEANVGLITLNDEDYYAHDLYKAKIAEDIAEVEALIAAQAAEQPERPFDEALEEWLEHVVAFADRVDPPDLAPKPVKTGETK